MKNLKENRIKRKIGRRWLLVVFLCSCAMVSTAQVKEGNVHLRANLVRWATLTADGSVEWQLKKEWSVLASGTWSSWSFKGNRYRIKEFAGEIRHYMGYMSTELPWYIGMRIYGGEFNYGFSKEKARQGDLLGGGIIAQQAFLRGLHGWLRLHECQVRSIQGSRRYPLHHRAR